MKTIPTHAVVELMVPDSASPSPKRFSNTSVLWLRQKPRFLPLN